MFCNGFLNEILKVGFPKNVIDCTCGACASLCLCSTTERTDAVTSTYSTAKNCQIWQGSSGPVGKSGISGEDGNPGPRVSA